MPDRAEEYNVDGYRYDSFFVDNGFEPATSGRRVDVIAGRSEEVIGTVPYVSAQDARRVVRSARTAFDSGPWRRLAASERAEVMRRLADGLDRHADELAVLGAEEQGAPIWFGRAFLSANPQWALRHFADLIEKFPLREVRPGGPFNTLVLREPVGVTLAITPFNAPLPLAIQKAAPALALGCSVIVKAPPQAPLSCYLLARVAAEAGLPPGVLSVVVADVPESELLVTHPGIDKVTFTGSTEVGRRIGELCGHDIRRITLELGGKSPAVLLPDVDLEQATEGLVHASVGMVQGEMCTTQSRILAPRARYDEVVDALTARIERMTVGDPLEETTAIGPLITESHRARVERYIALGKDEGAKVTVGGKRPASLERGWYLEPTLFAGADNSMTVSREEIFGPVAVVIPYGDVDDAVAIANDSPYGLSATVWSADEQAALDVAQRLDAGVISTNAFMVNPAAPFGGYKQSGVGRENDVEGLSAFVEYKSISSTAVLK
jgi:aldehyde dehydrogenase (NAD+)